MWRRRGEGVRRDTQKTPAPPRSGRWGAGVEWAMTVLGLPVPTGAGVLTASAALASRSLLARAGLVDGQGAALKHGTVEVVDGLLAALGSSRRSRSRVNGPSRGPRRPAPESRCRTGSNASRRSSAVVLKERFPTYRFLLMVILAERARGPQSRKRNAAIQGGPGRQGEHRSGGAPVAGCESPPDGVPAIVTEATPYSPTHQA